MHKKLNKVNTGESNVYLCGQEKTKINHFLLLLKILFSYCIERKKRLDLH